MNTVNIEAYDYHLMDLIANPIYSHIDMVLGLGRGEFLVEGHPSNFQDAELYAQKHSAEKDVWKAMQILDFDGND